ncbi:hypothetical protein D9619_005747 [Psilocybe cf. subviscida]|uniref:Metallo-beta-lactamase domain-containing protein n=1 Tax=Psilocybe cf. subviscida TaxID=2480587 RepID=A0A8H5BY47_9AGAR|nr:hypothetical protein D9619_005747 [Psilocybe cf. subviscida]
MISRGRVIGLIRRGSIPSISTTTTTMSTGMSVTFLGTSSGGGPSETRNCSSLVCDMLADGSLWMVDCAEGTARQFSLQPQGPSHLRMMKISKIFITHMHADHIMGIVPLLRNILFPPSIGPPKANHAPPRAVEIYGPAGIRLFVRQIMKMTLTRTSDTYVVHEMLRAEDTVTPCNPPAPSTNPDSHLTGQPDVLHSRELPGRDIRASSDGFWLGITQGRGRSTPVVVNAGPINHRDPCLGYTFTETSFPFRKLVILGDTYDPSPMIPLCINPSPSLLVHEATDSHISHHVDNTGKLSARTPAEVLERALARGHSVPEMAGAFAKLIGARDLVLNHIGGRFPAPRNPHDHFRIRVMLDIESHATKAWGSGKLAIAAFDFMRFEVPHHPRVNAQLVEEAEVEEMDVWETEVYAEPTAATPVYRGGHRGRRGGFHRGRHPKPMGRQDPGHGSRAGQSGGGQGSSQGGDKKRRK